MHTRQAIIKPLDQDYDKLNQFVHDLRTHSMYRPIVEQLMSMPGFVTKEYNMIEDKSGVTFISKITFDNKENFDNCLNEESYQSLWIYLELMATQSGLSFEVSDFGH